MIVLFNPRSTTPGRQPLPLSVLSLAAVLDGGEPWALVDGNLVDEPAGAIAAQLPPPGGRHPVLLAITVMPGPQLTQAVRVSEAIRKMRPDVEIVWGGYFPTEHTDVVMQSSMVDFVVRSQGEGPLLGLMKALRAGGGFEAVGSLSWRRNGTGVHNPLATPQALDDLPDLPYARVRMADYIHSNYLGSRTVAHNSSFGCPFACSFCAVVAMSNRRWLAQSPARVERALQHLVTRYKVNAIQMHDMDFFISEQRAAECAERMTPLGLSWWALGRIDTLMKYSDRTWRLLQRSGLKMVFSGAESGSDETLALMNKGGTSAANLGLELARRMRTYNVIPEFSFVLGTPPEPMRDVERTFDYIRRVKAINPATEIVLYTYSPVPSANGLFSEVSQRGFAFPRSLDEWASDRWREHALRRGQFVPWLSGGLRERIRNFETVLNAYYPTQTDMRLTGLRRAVLRALSAWRYRLGVYAVPYELKALQRLLPYRRPETTGF